MHHFSVWAPRASSCAVQVDGVTYAMSPASRGWWQADVDAADYGSTYQFLLDSDPHPYPDPRSAWQPDSVHGPSRLLNQSSFTWSDDKWSAPPLSEAIIYELHIGTFTPEGTFTAAIEHLKYLKNLGITHVELMPVNSFPGRWGWGYDGVSLFAPQEKYGGPEALKQLVDACHAAGLAVLLDVVYNHFGPVGNYTGKYGPYITEQHHTPWGGAINFEASGSDEVRRFFCDNALMWFRDYHFDGLRLDAIHAFVDRSAKHFLEQLSEEVEELSNQLGRKLLLIAESDLNDPQVVSPRNSSTTGEPSGSGGRGMDAQWSDDFHHSIFAFLSGERRSYYRDFGSITQIAKSLKSVFVFDGTYSEYRGRAHGGVIENLSGHRFLGYIQNHDQIGNRAFGDRIVEVVGINKAKLAAALIMTSPFVPMIFQGEEFASSSPFLYFADHEDPEFSRAVSEGRRREHAADGAWDSVPDPESQESFEVSKLKWSELDQAHHKEMLDWYRSLIHLRTSTASLRDGNLLDCKVSFDESTEWLTMERGQIQAIFNFGTSPLSQPVRKGSQILLTSDPEAHYEHKTVFIPPLAVAILSGPADPIDTRMPGEQS